jgi:hypothetical protein
VVPPPVVVPDWNAAHSDCASDRVVDAVRVNTRPTAPLGSWRLVAVLRRAPQVARSTVTAAGLAGAQDWSRFPST